VTCSSPHAVTVDATVPVGAVAHVELPAYGASSTHGVDVSEGTVLLSPTNPLHPGVVSMAAMGVDSDPRDGTGERVTVTLGSGSYSLTLQARE
jgi:hypothetical protein